MYLSLSSVNSGGGGIASSVHIFKKTFVVEGSATWVLMVNHGDGLSKRVLYKWWAPGRTFYIRKKGAGTHWACAAIGWEKSDEARLEWRGPNQSQSQLCKRATWTPATSTTHSFSLFSERQACLYPSHKLQCSMKRSSKSTSMIDVWLDMNLWSNLRSSSTKSLPLQRHRGR